MSSALGIVSFSGSHIYVEGLQDYRPIGAFSFLGRYRAIDFPISNMTNSGIDHIQVYINKMPRSLVEHLGTGRHYNINSKRGRLHLLFPLMNGSNPIYETDISAYMNNLPCIRNAKYEYVVIAPNYMVFKQDFDELLQNHIDSGADITLLYHTVDNAKESYLNCDMLTLNKQKGVLSIEKNRGSAKNRNIFMNTYVMKRELFIELIQKAAKISSMYTLPQIVNAACDELDIRGVAHRGFFAAVTDLKSYYDSSLSMLDAKSRDSLFYDNWPIYTRTNDSCPTHYFETACISSSIVSNGCIIKGNVESSIVGRGCTIENGAVVKNCIVLPGAYVGENVHIENQVIDTYAKIIHGQKIIGDPTHPGYIRKDDIL